MFELWKFIKKKNKKKYCNNKCQHEFQYKVYIENWLNGKESGIRGTQQISSRVKRYLLEKYDYKCQKCGWGEINLFTNTIPLEIHHIDNNPNNNTVDNLQLLCPNCHSLTENWKGSNKSSKRTYRRKTFQVNPEQE